MLGKDIDSFGIFIESLTECSGPFLNFDINIFITVWSSKNVFFMNIWIIDQNKLSTENEIENDKRTMAFDYKFNKDSKTVFFS